MTCELSLPLCLLVPPPDEDEETPMSQEQMDILEAGRPGTPPWQR